MIDLALPYDLASLAAPATAYLLTAALWWTVRRLPAAVYSVGGALCQALRRLPIVSITVSMTVAPRTEAEPGTHAGRR